MGIFDFDGGSSSSSSTPFGAVGGIAADIDAQRRAGKSDAQIGVGYAQRTAQANGASSDEVNAIGIAAAAASATPHAKNPCPIADRWFDATKSYHGVSAQDWDQLTCREKNQIMEGGVVGAQAVAIERVFGRPASDVVAGAAAAVKKIFHF